MKLNLLSIALLLTLTCILGCRRNPDSYQAKVFKWTTIDPAFDSIADRMDTKYLRMDTAISKDMEDLRQAYIVSDKKSQLLHRLKYWEAREVFTKTKDQNATRHLIEEAYHSTDTLNHPYDFARIKLFTAISLVKDPFNRYIEINKCRRAFEDLHDSLYMALCDVNNGNLMLMIDNYTSAQNYYLNADKILSHGSYKEMTPQIKINLAIIHHILGEDNKAIEMLDYVISLQDKPDNPVVLEMALMNKYRFTDSVEYMLRAFQIENDRGEYRAFKLLENMEMAKYQLNHNMPDSAAPYIKVVEENLSAIDDLEDEVVTAGVLLRHDLMTGQLEKARVHYDFLRSKEDSLKNKTTRNAIANAEINRKMETLRLRESEAEARRKTTVIVVIMIALILVIFAAWLTISYRKKMAREHDRLNQRLLRSREALATIRLHQKSTDAILDQFENQVEHANSTSGDMDTVVSSLKREIKIHKSKNAEWEYMVEKFDKIGPEFEEKMMKLYPTLTKKQVEFAGFIALGLSSRQIATILSIDMASVNTNRYRLRTKMGLQKTQSLEEEILKISTSKV